MSKIVSLVFILVLFVFAVSPVVAAKKRIFKPSSVSVSTSVTPSVSARLTGWKQYLSLSFRGVASTTGITYELTYAGNGTEQGVFGSIKPEEGNVTRTLFLGTCSNKVCVSHKNVGNLRLTITYKLKSGKALVKNYKVKY
ncbi:MAG: hypothetical protein WCV93_05165 [Candidatus Shapirobacteria bacterium]